MKILIEIDDEYIRQQSEDCNDKTYTRAINYELSWVNVAITPTYADGRQLMWLEAWIEPDKPQPDFSVTILEDVEP